MNDNKWVKLTDIVSVATAQANGWEIERSNDGTYWGPWLGASWLKTTLFRGRTKQPKKIVVTSECWRHYNGELLWKKPDWEPHGAGYKRFPAGDITGEIEE